MINVVEKRDCCGCSACLQACPKGCISMLPDEEGFAYPVVDKNICIKCGLCEKVCPILNHKDGEKREQGFVARSEFDNRMESSSGGIFYLFAHAILEAGGVVCGAAYNDKNLVNHKIVDNENDLYSLLGSKYIQSNLENQYTEIKKYLNDGRKVLFSGTACQVAGLKGYLMHDYDNLYTVDVLCHGVPSPGVWTKYVQYLEKKENKKLKHVNFRDKVTGWHDYTVSHTFEDGTILSTKASENIFMNLFLSDYILRPSCHKCQFKNISRISDVTIGDAWGIENWKPEMDDDKGTSVIVTHSEQGMELLNLISKNLKISPCDVDEALPPNAASRKPVGMPRGRALVFYNYRKNRNFESLVASSKSTFINKILRRIIVNK